MFFLQQILNENETLNSNGLAGGELKFLPDMHVAVYKIFHGVILVCFTDWYL